MLQIKNDTKVYIPCPAGVVTGGAELLHQLVDVINRNGGDAYIVYFDNDGNVKKIPDDYSKYNIKTSLHYEDSPQNVIVIYEGYYELALKIKKAQIVLWWLSVDNYFLCNKHTLAELIYYQICFPVKYKMHSFLGLCKQTLVNPKDRVSLGKLSKLNVACNAYQSEYAKDFLIKHDFHNLYSLKDYINNDNFEGEKSYYRDNIVIYNPKKGYEFTHNLIISASDIKWVPIQNMNRKQVIELMRKAKVYVDFGYHPGKDRLPREAAINGCCIVTGKQGSAGYDGDIHIPIQYKHNQSDKDIPIILNQIRLLLSCYEEKILDFTEYQNIIKIEKKEFENNAIKLFSKTD